MSSASGPDLRGSRDTALISAVASDLDGTLLRPDHTVSDFTREQLARVVRSGRGLVFVTGRPPRWMPPVIAETGHSGTAVCANGAVVLDVAAERIIGHSLLRAAELAAVCDVIRTEMGADVRFAVEVAPLGPLTGSRLIHEEGFAAVAMMALDAAPLADVLAAQSAVKLLARGSGPVADTGPIAARVIAATGDAVTVSHSSRTHQLLEVAPPGVTKASTLADLALERGWDPAHVVAFGDMPNDIPLLTWAGHGVAVASADPAVLEVAGEVVADPQHDGVAHWLAEHIPAG